MFNADDYPDYRDYLRLKFGPNRTTDDLPEYKEYLKNLYPSTEKPCEIRNYDQKFDIFENVNREIHLPIPCTEITDNSGNYNFYCIALLFLWFMLIVSAILYQFRSIINIKSEINRKPNIKISGLQTTNNQSTDYDINGHNTN
ncbi:hypothetical protein ACQ4LE_005870 [Meloidogyne hapla]